MKPQAYIDERPEARFAGSHAWARAHTPDLIQDLIRLCVLPACMLLYRVWPQGGAEVPGAGAAILAPNHFSTLDHFFCGIYLRRRLRFMAKSQLFTGPLGWVLQHAGAFPVRRGQRDESAIDTALSVLERGGVVAIYPEGGRSRTSVIATRARPGVGRLALESGAPVVPVAIYGSSRVRAWRRLQFPKVLVRYGTPMRFERVAHSTREQQQEVADEVLAAVRALYRSVADQGTQRPALTSLIRRPITR